MNLPMACSLTAQDLKDRRSEWASLISANLLGSERVDGGVRLRLRSDERVEEELQRLIDLEQECCAWIEWIVARGDEIQVLATARDRAGGPAIAEMFGLS